MELKGLRETRGSGSFSSRTKTVLSNEYGKILPESQQLNVWGGGVERQRTVGALHEEGRKP